MEGLQRSAVSFRRQGSSGMIWDDKFLAGLINQQKQQDEEQKINNNKNESDEEKKIEQPTAEIINKVDDEAPAALKIERSRSNGRGHRTGRVSPAIEPPSPKLSACGFCGAFGKSSNTRRRPPKSKGKRVM